MSNSKKWKPTPVFLPEEFHGQRSLAGYTPSQRVRHDWARTHTEKLNEFTTAAQPVQSKSRIKAQVTLTVITLKLGKIKCRRRRGQQRMRCLDGITNAMDMNLCKVWEMLGDTEAWHATVHVVTKSQKWLADWTTICGGKQRWSLSAEAQQVRCSLFQHALQLEWAKDFALGSGKLKELGQWESHPVTAVPAKCCLQGHWAESSTNLQHLVLE